MISRLGVGNTCPSVSPLVFSTGKKEPTLSRYGTGGRKRWSPVSLISRVGVIELLNLPTRRYYSLL